MVSLTLPLQVTFGRGFLTLAYFLIPGYIAYKAYLHARIREDDFHRFDRLLYTVLFGFVSLYIASIISRLNLLVLLTDPWPVTFSIETFFNNGKELSKLGDTTVLQFVNGITLQAFIGTIIAYSLGKRLVPEEREEFDAKQPYETAMESIDRGETLRIITTNGAEFKGLLHQSGSRKDNNDFLLRKPHRWDSDEKQFTRVEADSKEDLMYFNYNDISVIHFAGSKLPDLSPDNTGDNSATESKDSGGALAKVTDNLEQINRIELELGGTQANESNGGGEERNHVADDEVKETEDGDEKE